MANCATRRKRNSFLQRLLPRCAPEISTVIGIARAILRFRAYEFFPNHELHGSYAGPQVCNQANEILLTPQKPVLGPLSVLPTNRMEPGNNLS